MGVAGFLVARSQDGGATYRAPHRRPPRLFVLALKARRGRAAKVDSTERILQSRRAMSITEHPGKTTRADVVIIGGGLVGSSLGHALAQAGLDVVVVDREPPAMRADRAYDGRASAIAFGSRRVLEGLGLWHELADAACPILDIRVSDGASRLFLHYDHREVGDQPLGHIVENTAIRRALLGALDGPSGQSRRRPLHLAPAAVAAMAFGPGAVDLALADGRRLAASLVVGADGRQSQTRARAGIGVTQWRYGQTGIVCTVSHGRPHRNVAHERFLPAGPFALLPMTGMAEHPHR
ncbi:MAG: FAD-dependent oxidoreductase, partial [Alphaproteobacteria bacterium]|nr:FAD-dependent oxidoreductase [Alphaproteobacteria bacterium]